MRDVLEFWIQCRCSKWPPSASKHCRSGHHRHPNPVEVATIRIQTLSKWSPSESKHCRSGHHQNPNTVEVATIRIQTLSKWPPSASKHCRSRRTAARVYIYFWATLYFTGSGSRPLIILFRSCSNSCRLSIRLSESLELFCPK